MTDTQDRSPARRAEIKRRRAELLAARSAERALDAGGARTRHLVVRLGPELVGLPGEHVERIQFMPPVTPLPGVPAFVAGLVCLVGEVLTMIDLRRLFGLGPSEEPDELARMILVRAGAERLALRVDGVVGLERFTDVRDLPRSETTSGWLTPEQVQGVAEGRILLVDLPRVLRDPRLIVDQE